MPNMGLSDGQLNYFQEIDWKNSIKTLRISNNKIQNITCILENLVNLVSLFANDNFIEKVCFKKPLKMLTKLSLKMNKLTSLQIVENIPEIKELILGNNY